MGSTTTDEDEPRRSVARWIAVGVGMLAFVVALRAFVLRGFVIRSGSMSPTVLAGDVIVVDRTAYGGRAPIVNLDVPGFSSPERFDVVVFQRPGAAEGTIMAKRLVGLPRDTIMMRDHVLYINGDRIVEPYVRHLESEGRFGPPMSWQVPYLTSSVTPAKYYPTMDTWGPLVIPPGHYFVMGDRRDASVDSRHWGFVNARHLKGRAAFVSFSVDSERDGAIPILESVRWERIGTRLY